MHSLQVREGETILVQDRPIAGKKTLSTHHAQALLVHEHLFPAEAVHWGFNRLSFNRCGFFYFEGCAVEVLPQLAGDKISQQISRDVTIKMLRAAGYYPSQSPVYRPAGLHSLSFFDRYIFQFCEDLQYQIRKGMIRSYVSHHGELKLLKGRLLLDKQLQSGHSSGMSVCEFDELSVDNAYNQLLKQMLTLFLHLAVAGRIRRKVTELLRVFSAVSNQPLESIPWQNLNFDRHSSRYETLFAHCRRLLSHSRVDARSGSLKSLCFAFHMHSLFKETMTSRLRNSRLGNLLEFKFKGPKKFLAQDSMGSREHVPLQPDVFVSNKQGSLLSLINLQWDRVRSGKRWTHIPEQDVAPLLAYAVGYGVKRVFLIYPSGSQTGADSFNICVKGAEVDVVVMYVDVAADELECQYFEELLY
ncbi:MAG: McrC family protein [Gammaproteobacteria bacterium]|nr:McrC family protein [Gammaproteobacteria bacterium]MDH5801939.1 McrC family protein [Gammaproteobacteria bacterium]